MLRKKIARTLAFILGLTLGGGLFVFLLWRTGLDEVGQALLTFGWIPVFGFVSISLLNFCLYTLRWKVILDTMLKGQKTVPFHRMFLHRMSGFAAGYLTPAAQVAGEPIRVAMLRSDDVPLKEATSSVVLDLAFEITSFVLYVAIGLGFAFSQGLGGEKGFGWSLIFISIVLVFMVTFFVATATGSGFFHRVISGLRLNRWKSIAMFEDWLKETEGIMSQFFVGKKKLIVGVSLLSLVMAAFKGVEAIFIAHFLGVNIPLADAFLLSTLPGVALLLPIPGGLGVFEGSNATLFALLGLNLNPIAYTMIIRIRDFVFIAIGVCHALVAGERIVLHDYAKRS